MTIKRVALAGATGTLGPFILQALIVANFQVSLLIRSTSKSVYPTGDSVQHLKIPEAATVEDLAAVLRGQDALVLAISGSATEESKKLIDAARTAGVQRIIPADFGSCDSSDPRSLSLLPLYREKKKVRDYLQQLASATFSYTTIICGHFFDHGLTSELLAFNVSKRHAVIFDGGDVEFCSSLLPNIGLATAKVLQLPEQTRDQLIYIESVRTTQNRLLRALQLATGTTEGDWNIEQVNSDHYIKTQKEKLGLDANQPVEGGKKLDENTVERLVAAEGIVNGNWEGRGHLHGLANEMLGLPRVITMRTDDDTLTKLVKEALKDSGH